MSLLGLRIISETAELSLSDKSKGNNRLFIVTFLLIILTEDRVRGALVESPQNGAFIAGDDVTLTCKTNLSVSLQWNVATSNSGPDQIFNGARVVQKFEKDFKIPPNERGEYYLNFKASNKTANQFTCYEPETDNEESADVMVLESKPSCVLDINSSPGNATYVCTVSAFGNWNPRIEWKIDGPSEIYNSIKGSVLTSRMQISEANQNLKGECVVKFSLENYQGKATAKNIPSSFSSSCPDYLVVTTPTSNLNTTSAPVPPIIKIIVGVVLGLAGGGCVAAVLVYRFHKRSEVPPTNKNPPEGGSHLLPYNEVTSRNQDGDSAEVN